jgi:transposase-like protein
MSFTPPRCPNLACPKHRNPDGFRCIRWGYFSARCRLRREQRYRCSECRKTFSRQTFRHDYRDRRPEINGKLFCLLTSGVGFRQAASLLDVDQATAQNKMHKMSRTCGLLHHNLSTELPTGREYLLDEEESYEQASIRPLTVPILIERTSYFVVASAVGSIRRLAPVGTVRRRRQELEERKCGKRPDQSRQCVAQVMRALRQRTTGSIVLSTDQKSSYATLAREVFGPDVVHETTPGSAPRTTFNRLFPVNLSIAMSRDNCGRLRRRSWLVSKLAKRLEGQLEIFTVYRNYVRPRTRRSPRHQTPANLLGLLPRQLNVPEALRWRQDWGLRSIHPMSSCGLRAIGGLPLK